MTVTRTGIITTKKGDNMDMRKNKLTGNHYVKRFTCVTCIIFIVIFAVSLQALGRRAAKEVVKTVPNATANVKGFDGQNIRGVIGFYQKSHDDGVLIMGEIMGLEPSQIYAMHIHEVGSCDSPKAPGEHFDPENTGKKHGDAGCNHGEKCHAGDLPNVTAGATGTAAVNYTDKYLSTDDSSSSVVERSIVIHNTENGKPTEPVACGVIQHLR